MKCYNSPVIIRTIFNYILPVRKYCTRPVHVIVKILWFCDILAFSLYQKTSSLSIQNHNNPIRNIRNQWSGVLVYSTRVVYVMFFDELQN